MKVKHGIVALTILFSCSTLATAGTIDKLTQNDGMTALQIGDTAGYEIISRTELEEVRGEIVPVVAYYSLAYGYPILFAIGYSTVARGYPLGSAVVSAIRDK